MAKNTGHGAIENQSRPAHVVCLSRVTCRVLA